MCICPAPHWHGLSALAARPFSPACIVKYSTSALNSVALIPAGEVVGYDVQPVNIQSDETAALNRLTITVNVRYVNTLDTEKNSEGTFTRFADYDSSSDLSSVEETLVREISDQLSQDIFDRTLGSW